MKLIIKKNLAIIVALVVIIFATIIFFYIFLNNGRQQTKNYSGARFVSSFYDSSQVVYDYDG